MLHTCKKQVITSIFQLPATLPVSRAGAEGVVENSEKIDGTIFAGHARTFCLKRKPVAEVCCDEAVPVFPFSALQVLVGIAVVVFVFLAYEIMRSIIITFWGKLIFLFPSQSSSQGRQQPHARFTWAGK